MLCCALQSWFSHVPLFETLWNLAWQAPLSMDFSRQEYWNGLPWPPPGDLPDLGIKPSSPALQVDFFTVWAISEAQEYWSGSLPILQGVFLTQESNRCLLHCRWILYQLSYQGSSILNTLIKFYLLDLIHWAGHEIFESIFLNMTYLSYPFNF